MGRIREFFRYRNLIELKSYVALLDCIGEKNFDFFILKIESNKTISPPAQGKVGRNGQHFSKNQTSNETIDFYLLYVWGALYESPLRG